MNSCCRRSRSTPTVVGASAAIQVTEKPPSSKSDRLKKDVMVRAYLTTCAAETAPRPLQAGCSCSGWAGDSPRSPEPAFQCSFRRRTAVTLELDVRDTPNDRGSACRSCGGPATASKGSELEMPTPSGGSPTPSTCSEAVVDPEMPSPADLAPLIGPPPSSRTTREGAAFA